MTIPEVLKKLFDLMSSATSPIQGNRTHSGAVIAAAVLVYALYNYQFELATTAFALLMSVIGLKPTEPLAADAPPAPPSPGV